MMRVYLSCIVALLFVVSCYAQSCATWTAPTGNTYNLAALIRPTSNPWSADEAGTNFKYYWNICQNLNGIPAQVTETGPATVIQIDQAANSAHATGRIGTQTISETANGIEITYKNNIDDMCKDAGGVQNVQRNTNILINCNQGTEGSVVSVTEPNPADPANKCRYLITMHSRHACKGNANGGNGGNGGNNGGGGGKGKGGLSGGSVFLIIFFCLAVTYVIGGIVYNKVRNNAAGTDMILHFEFWSSLPGLCMDGVRFIKNKITGQSYSSL